MTAGSDALGFREEYFLLQLKCDLLVGEQDHAYSFRNTRNPEHAAQLAPK
jgi:predicted GNAT family N-acyltransferase